MHEEAEARRAIREQERSGLQVERTDGLWRLRSYGAARQLLQARGATSQAGFTAEFIPKGVLKHHPILISDGPLHDEQRRLVGRFFAPAVVQERYLPLMESSADELVSTAVKSRGCTVDLLALTYSVEVTRQVVGLTESSVDGLSRRLVAFFNQPPFDLSKPGLGRSRRQWALAALNGLGPILRFHVADVRPAIRSRRRRPRSDVVTHLISQGYTDMDILVECLTYGTAGMVTTREFIAMALWHLLTTPTLLDGYRGGDHGTRLAVLEEIIRLEPVVGHLYRRMQTPLTLKEGDDTFELAAGDLVDVCVRDTNIDPHEMGEQSGGICPARPRERGTHSVGLSFGDGAHRCPGQHLALLESEVLISRLIRAQPVIGSEPRIEWDDLTAGYRLRGFTLTFMP